MARSIILALLLAISASASYGQKPKDGTYTYSIAFAEWGGKSLGNTCLIKIKGDSITVIQNDNRLSLGKKGDIIDKGVIVRHSKTGQWIIAHSPKDKDAKEVGGCSDGPAVIDFKKKVFWLC